MHDKSYIYIENLCSHILHINTHYGTRVAKKCLYSATNYENILRYTILSYITLF